MQSSGVLQDARIRGSPSEYLWEDDAGTVHRIPQGEGGEQGDALMPLLFCLGQHRALEAAQRQLRDGERLLALLDDIYLATPPARVGPGYTAAQQELWIHAGIRVHTGKTKVWNRVGIRPIACNVLERIARVGNPQAVVWTGSGIPVTPAGCQDFGDPLGHPDFVAAHLQRVSAEHQTLLQRIPSVVDVQSAWLLLLHCAAARACYHLRVVCPSAVEEFARHHDESSWQCLSQTLQVDLDQRIEAVREVATLPLSLGVFGLRGAVRMREPAYWASWADCLPMIRARHPEIAMSSCTSWMAEQRDHVSQKQPKQPRWGHATSSRGGAHVCQSSVRR